ncbi:MAG TPA: prepilin-type N-terminal cleavage/methylation domain-containing protein [Candidatus Binatia bacterium]|jgi:type II secretion system protein I|nr:prepilin-type N-terminal cleavage/methylation domain-containing protein [Candidatus Binatia bacterium]
MRHAPSRRRSRSGFGLLEVLVALVVLAVGVTAMQRLVTRSVGTIDTVGRTTRAMLAAQALLADAALTPPEPGRTAGIEPGGLRFERDVVRTPHPALREVHVRVHPDDDGAPCELVEVIHVPPA